jgi:flagellar basal body-associated protein FliL
VYIGKLPLKTNINFSTAILLTGVAVFFYATQALAASGEKSAKDDPLNWVPPTHVQMLPMMVPAGNTTVAVTFVLEAIKRKRTEGICKRMPIVRDAILRTLSREPIPVKRRRLVTDGIDNLILDPINRAIKRNYVKKIYVMPGAIKMGEAKVKHKAYAVIDGCLNILRSEKARAQALKAAQEK